MKSSTASHTGPLSAICPPRECWPSAHIDHEKPSYVELENERTKTSLFLQYCAYLRFLSQSTFARLEYVLELVQTTAGQCDNESNSQSGTGGQQVEEQSRTTRTRTVYFILRETVFRSRSRSRPRTATPMFPVPSPWSLVPPTPRPLAAGAIPRPRRPREVDAERA